MADYFATGADASIVEAENFKDAADKIANIIASNWYGDGHFAVIAHRESYTNDGTEEAFTGRVGKKYRDKITDSQNIRLNIVRI